MSVMRWQRRWIDGVLELIKEQMWCAPWLRATRREVVFRGRTERDVRRKVVRYWSDHQHRLGMNLHQFMRRCQMTEDGSIVFAL